MFKKSFIFIAFIFVVATLSAQKKSAGVHPFTYNTGQINKEQADLTYAEVSSLIYNSGRFVPVNRDAFKAVVKERELNKEESFIDGAAISEAKDIGAQILFVGNIIGTTENQDPIIHLTAVDVSTNKILISEVISRTERRKVDLSGSIKDINSSLWNVSKDTKTATQLNTVALATDIFTTVSDMTKTLKTQVDNFLDVAFPLKLTIARFEDDGKQIKKALIKGDRTIGLAKGNKVEFVEEKIVKERDGSEGTLYETIASGKVEDFSGDYIVINVTEKGKALYTQKENLNIFITRKK
jgi:curli biogenesis system outer membrane secretion channel CsgG